MTTTDFLKVKINSVTPTFKDMIGLKEIDNTSKLLNFITLLHPNQLKEVQGSKGTVWGKRFYVFTIYTTCIIRTDVEAGTKKMYKF